MSLCRLLCRSSFCGDLCSSGGVRAGTGRGTGNARLDALPEHRWRQTSGTCGRGTMGPCKTTYSQPCNSSDSTCTARNDKCKDDRRVKQRSNVLHVVFESCKSNVRKKNELFEKTAALDGNNKRNFAPERSHRKNKDSRTTTKKQRHNTTNAFQSIRTMLRKNIKKCERELRLFLP